MAKLFVVQDRYNEEITEWHIYTNKAKAESKYEELKAEYEEDWQVELETVSGPNCGFLIGFDDDLGEVFADPIEDVSGYELESYYGNATAYLIGPKSKEGNIVVGGYGDLSLSGNLEELAYWEQSELISGELTSKPVNEPTKNKPKPSNYDKVLKVANVMRSEWEKVKPEDKGVNSVEGLPLKRDDTNYTLSNFDAKMVWFANILNNAVFKCNRNTKYSKVKDFKELKANKNIFKMHGPLSPKERGYHTWGHRSFYFEWPENITKEVNKLVSAAEKDQEIMIKAVYLFIRDYLNKLPPPSLKDGTSTDMTGYETYFKFPDFYGTIYYLATNILGKINDPDMEKLKEPDYYGLKIGWAPRFPAFESVQSIKQLKYVPLYEGFVKNLKK